MGCTPSKPTDAVPAPPPIHSVGSHDETVATERRVQANGSHAPSARPKQPQKTQQPQKMSSTDSPASKSQQSKSSTSRKRDEWSRVWKTLSPYLLDPADIPSTMDDLMARVTNRLSAVELLFLQRRVRAVVQSLPQAPASAGIRVFTNTTAESRLVAERHHLLDEAVISKVFSGLLPADVLKSAYLLMLHLSESLWARVADIAVQNCRVNELEMDVNKQIKDPQNEEREPTKVPTKATTADLELPPGISFAALAFLVALGRHGTRVQRLHLLFYLFVHPRNLEELLQHHPAGGVPCWLLEVDQECVLSLASMAHYYTRGTTFAPVTFPDHDSHKGQTDNRLGLSGSRVQQILSELLRERDLDSNHGAELEDSNSAKNPSPKRTLRRNSKTNTSASSDDETAQKQTPKTAVMEYFIQARKGKRDDYDGEIFGRFQAACETTAATNNPFWNMADFDEWAREAVDDRALDVIFHKLFGVGILPTPQMERELVVAQWRQWQETDSRLWYEPSTMEVLADSVKKLFDSSNGNRRLLLKHQQSNVYGGIGGFDGRGGIGYGVMYCVDKKWWDEWQAYVGWNWKVASVGRTHNKRPCELSTENLLDRSLTTVVSGTMGSYELMKKGLEKDVDYVLLPPAVWDVLYELYGGGPPLPRMLRAPEQNSNFVFPFSTETSMNGDGNTEVDHQEIMKVPAGMAVETHPWVLHVHLCDPQQPYRRGDAGPLSIRVMTTPDQPFWRVYVEVIARLTTNHLKVYGPDGRGKARLWKKIDPAGSKDASTRYGPWHLLCRNRSAILPMMTRQELEENYGELLESWQAYADHATTESIGLSDGDHLMVECAIVKKAGGFMWPREAAAKAGRVRRLADEDMKFRRLLRGIDENSKPLDPQPELVGMTVDAMDASGRWYQVDIVEVEDVTVGTEEDEELDSEEGFEGEGSSNGEKRKITERRRQVKVDFRSTEDGGHPEWIDVESDHLATAGRFTLGKAEESPTAQKTVKNGNNPNEPRKMVGPAVKKANSDANSENGGKVCTFPGFGACGLANLGNTCYANSAIQCISYMPLLRAYLLSSRYKASGDLNKDNPLGTGGKMLEEVAELLRLMWSAKMGEKSPTRFRTQLGKNHSQFSGADQHDAQEFLNYMLDVLHEDSNKIRNKPYVEGLEDDWVKKNNLPRVGEEAWRRFLRRNRSIMADVAMGQVLNTVTCPVCHFSSRNFDPFNLLSIPFPTVDDVVFQCTVVRRSTAVNCPWVLNRPRKGDTRRSRFSRADLPKDPKPPSDQFSVEQYVIAMSRLADSGDLKLQLQNICGIPATELRLCTSEEIVSKNAAQGGSVVKRRWKVTPLTEKEGPCVHLAKSSSEDSNAPVVPTQIIAYETTLRQRDRRDEESDTTTDGEEEQEETEPDVPSAKEQRTLHKLLDIYGDDLECRVFDTDPLMIAKAISRSLWPRSEDELKLGLRVDAIDHRDHWFPGSVVEIIEAEDGEADDAKDDELAGKRKVRIHFDNFSSKWDEMYSIDHFNEGRVRPLYSHASPRPKPTEFAVHHRFTDRNTRQTALFGQTFYLQCPNEWSTARAGAHILAQASRYIRQASGSAGPVDVDAAQETEARVQRLYDKTQSAISDLIDLLIDCDREYVRLSLGVSEHNEGDGRIKPFRNPAFDATSLSTALVKKVTLLLHRLPFDVRICMVDSPLGDKPGASNEEVPFPFSLMRTIGNYINAKHAVVLQWREPPSDKKSGSKPVSYLNAPVMYVPPMIAVDKISADNLNTANAKKSKARPGSGGLHLGVCLTEFCKVQQLSLTDSWRCPRCKDFREGKQNMNLWRLPDLLTFHIKRFNCSARWREKITTKVNFPLTGLDMSEWCHSDSPALQNNPEGSYVYDLIGVLNHYGSMTGGHYVAMCKATACGKEGREEVAYNFNGKGTNSLELEDDDLPAGGWRIGRPKVEVNQSKIAAAAASKSVAQSAEPLWLQFDDELVEPIPPRHVVSEMAYVLFYRRRRLTPANVAKYCTLE